MGDLKEGLADALQRARQRSLGLLDPLSEADQRAQHSPLMSPLVWDLAHVGHYEELWLLRAVARTQPIDPAHDDIYDAFKHVRKERARLPILGPAEARRHIAMVRGLVLDVLEKVELDPAVPLLSEGFVYGMVAQHEHQHDETMLATLQLMASPEPYPHGGGPAPVPPAGAGTDVLVPGGPFVMGTGGLHQPPPELHPFAYDNERPAHVVDLDPFRIDTFPVTNREYLAFVEAGGYDEPRFWSEAGWAHRCAEELVAPLFWSPAGGGSWTVRRYGAEIDLPLDEPVQHVCWYEADAYARFAGGRLPTEAEWEKAARHGVERLFGDVWQWTSSDFTAYPGFSSFPYKEYSEVFYGSDYKVLRGGSWATSPLVARTTFRNWDFPVRRQIFAGFRCARDA